MPVSEFRRQKLHFVFDRFFDVNKSGTIEKKDFELAVEVLVCSVKPSFSCLNTKYQKQICRIRGWSAGDPKYQETKDRFLQIWEALRLRADANKDEQVSRDEWCQLWTDPARNEDWQKSYMNFMFQLQDTSGDGCIDVGEFISVCSSFGINADESRKAFEALSKNGKTIVDVDFYTGLWNDYFFSDDRASLGNYIFGKTSFP